MSVFFPLQHSAFFCLCATHFHDIPHIVCSICMMPLGYVVSGEFFFNAAADFCANQHMTVILAYQRFGLA